MSERIPFEEITEDMVLEEDRKQCQHLSHDFQHLEVRAIDNWEKVTIQSWTAADGRVVYEEVDETEYDSVRAYKFVIDCTILSGWQSRYEHYQPMGWLFHLTECTEEDEEDQLGSFLGHHIDEGEHWD